ncbi:RICIN domain-containing protein [Hymenobacter sp. BT175]|uniref:RICIN domain-containing protein n=1 Tax=Hymenobacter translucens TaxID=2886507 RepID=UPI001D0EE624|nr:RICIN domain-containing protein [Hymenobacter translucens]MCC2548065.1 RICIN domain-containing protein [Hymenobacter translucens]
MRYFPRHLLLLLLLALTVGPAWAQQTAPAPDPGVYYGIVARGSGRSLDITGSSAEAGAVAVQWEFTHSPSQQWRFVRINAGSEYYRIEGRHSGKCLTVDKPDENAPLVQRPFTGSLYQQWKLVAAGPTGTVQLVSRGNEKCLSLLASDKANGTAIVNQRPMNRATQQWRLFPLRLSVDPAQGGFGPAEPLTALNTPGNELQPVLSPDGKTLYLARTKFTGNLEGNTDSGDIWVSTSVDEGVTWGPATRLDALNTPQNNGVMAITGDKGQHLLVRGTYERDGTFRDEGVSRVARSLGRNDRPERLPITSYYSAGTSTGFFQSADEKVLLLSLDRADAYGANDLYVSLPGAGGWSEPRNLGGTLNSPGFEFAPWLAPDGKTLYFSSYGHAGYGSSDIFVSTRLDDTWINWTTPRNLGPTLNGPGFDAYFTLSADGRQAYFASARTANGPADLFRTASRAPVADTVKKPAISPELARRQLLTGQVVDAKTQKGVTAVVKANRLGNEMVFNASATTDASGSFQFTLPPGRYRLAATSGGFLTATDTVVMSGPVNRTLTLVPASVGARLELPTLIFAQGKFNLLPASYGELNRLARTLTDNPTVNIRLEGHTDNQGDAALNQKLSEDRVAEVKRYLVSRGVAEARITTVGFGGSKPRSSNEREETRKLNRRVEFTIVK